MPATLTLIDLRNMIEIINREVLDERGGEASNDEILERVRESRAKEVALLTDKLVNSALTKLLNDVARRRCSRSYRDGPDLFGEYRVPQNITTAIGKKKEVASLTLQEADRLIEARRGKRDADDKKGEEFKRMVDACLRPSLRLDLVGARHVPGTCLSKRTCPIPD